MFRIKQGKLYNGNLPNSGPVDEIVVVVAAVAAAAVVADHQFGRSSGDDNSDNYHPKPPFFDISGAR